MSFFKWLRTGSGYEEFEITSVFGEFLETFSSKSKSVRPHPLL